MAVLMTPLALSPPAAANVPVSDCPDRSGWMVLAAFERADGPTDPAASADEPTEPAANADGVTEPAASADGPTEPAASAAACTDPAARVAEPTHPVQLSVFPAATPSVPFEK